MTVMCDLIGMYRIFRREMSFAVIWVCTLIIGTTGITATQVYAQDGAMIEEVIVMARKREEQIQDVPISIAVFSSEDQEARSLTSLRELGQVTTNFSFYTHG